MIWPLILPGLLFMPTPQDSQPDAQPPKAAMKDHWSTWHGTKVNDPWSWLREKSNPDVIKHLEAENHWTEAQTKAIQPFADALYQEMLGRIKQTDLSVPVRRGRFYYYSRTEEGKQYPIQCRRAGNADGSHDPKAPEELLLDLNVLAEGKKFLSLGGFSVSDQDQQLLYTTDTTGFRQYSLYLKDLKSGKTTGPLAERVTSLSWAGDENTVFFTTEDPVTKRSNQLWRLTLGKPAPELQL
jgi:oligopeptidase B